MRALRPKRKELIDCLERLRKEEIVYIATVMYGGRDYLTYGEKPDFNQLFNYLKPQAAGLMCSIIGKTPLANYLKAGIEVSKIK